MGDGHGWVGSLKQAKELKDADVFPSRTAKSSQLYCLQEVIK
jgi:hypothetical protein